MLTSICPFHIRQQLPLHGSVYIWIHGKQWFSFFPFLPKLTQLDSFSVLFHTSFQFASVTTECQQTLGDLPSTYEENIHTRFFSLCFVFISITKFQELWLSNVQVRVVLGGIIYKTKWGKTRLVQHVSYLKISLYVCKKQHCMHMSIIHTLFTIMIPFPLQFAL